MRHELSSYIVQAPRTYIEPFLGSGAVFFHLCPSSAILADANSALIQTYLTIRDAPAGVEFALKRFAALHSDKFYYKVRSSRFFEPTLRAAQFIYLNKTCWNGLYRVNRSGVFNVPRGTKSIDLTDNFDFGLHSKVLLSAEIVCQDFESVIDRAIEGDLVYCDPPYTVHHNFNGFLKYNDKIFDWDDQKRLRLALGHAVSRGANVIVSNAGHQSVIELYEGLGTLRRLNRSSVISGLSKGRGRYDEVLVYA